MKSIPKPTYRLNVFALPSQTTILAGMILIVVIGALVGGSIEPAPIPLWPIALINILLVIRSFLSVPERECNHRGFKPITQEYSLLQQAIDQLSDEMGIHPPPIVLISAMPYDLPAAFGSFRRKYIGIGSKHALMYCQNIDCLQSGDQLTIEPKTRAILTHELSHFKHQDVWKIGFTKDLLTITSLFMLWASTFLVGYGMLLAVAKDLIIQFTPEQLLSKLLPSNGLSPDNQSIILNSLKFFMPTASEWAVVQQKAATIDMLLVEVFILGAALSFILVCGLLWFFYWHKLLRVRELYADAAAAQKNFYATLATCWSGYSPKLVKNKFLEDPYELGKNLRNAKKLNDTHPTPKEKFYALVDPSYIYDPWWVTALLVGGTAILLEILLSGPMTWSYMGSFPMQFITLALFVLIALNLIPLIARGDSVKLYILKIVSSISFVQLVIVGSIVVWLNILLIFSKTTLNDIVTIAVLIISRSSTYVSEANVENLPRFVRDASISNIAQVFIVAALLLLTLYIATHLIGRVFTWYGFPAADKKLLKVVYLIIACMASSISLVMLPLISICFPIHVAYSMSWLIAGCLLGMVIICVGLWFFFRYDHKYNGNCPYCGYHNSGSYHLGDVCGQCKNPLHLWLTSPQNYE